MILLPAARAAWPCTVRKGDYHGVLLALEAITGKKVVDLDVPVPAGTVVTTPTAGDAPKP